MNSDLPISSDGHDRENGEGSANPPNGPGTKLRYFGDYELLDEIARGGMGIVYRARQLSLNRTVAIKMILSGHLASEAEVKRFRMEAEAAANLDHPNIVPIYEIGEHAGQHYFAMRLVDGENLARRIVQFKADLQAVARFMATVARAVHHAHQRGILHRDLKPSNILADETDAPQVTDFGLAKLLEQDSSLTQSGTPMGTPNFMSPEQAQGNTKQLTTASDVFSLGAILYQMLTGIPPFQGETPLDTIRKVVEAEPQRPSQLNPKVDGDLETICLKCLDKDINRRYGSAEALAEDLERWLKQEPILARPISTLARGVKWARRRPAIAALLAVLLLSLSSISVLTVVNKERLRIERDAANLARKAETTERQRAQASELESRRRLVRMNLTSGARFAEKGDWTGALLWFLEAMKFEQGGSSVEDTHRLRIGNTLFHSPRIIQMWFPEKATMHAEFSPDGKWLLAVGNGTARIWETATGRPASATFLCQPNVTRPMFCMGGSRILAVSGEDSTMVRLLDVPTGIPASPALQHQAKVVSAIITPDGQQVFAICSPSRLFTSKDEEWRSEIHIWDVASGTEVRPPLRCKDSLLLLNLSPDGRWLAAIGSSGCAILWDLMTSRTILFDDRIAGEVAIVPPLMDSAEQIARNPQSLLPDIPPHSNWRWPVGNGLAARAVEFSADNSRIAFACSNGVVQVWSLTSLKRLYSLWHDPSQAVVENTGIEQCAFSPDGKHILTVGKDGFVRTWDELTGRPIARFTHHTDRVSSASFSPDGQWILTEAGEEAGPQSVQIRDAKSGEPLSSVFAQSGWAQRASFSPDGAGLLTVGVDDAIRLWSLASGRDSSISFQHKWEDVENKHILADGIEPTLLQRTSLRGNSVVTSGAFSSDGKQVVTVSDNGSSRVWNAITGVPITPYVRLDMPLQGAAFSRDGRYFATVGGMVQGKGLEANQSKQVRNPLFEGGGVACVWDAKTGRPVTPPIRVESPLKTARFSPDGRWLLTEARQGMWLWEAKTGQPASLSTNLNSPFTRIAFSHDGQIIAACKGGEDIVGSANTKTEIRIYDGINGKPITSLQAEVGELADFQFSPDSRWLVTLENEATPSDSNPIANYDVLTRVWDVRTGRQVSPTLRSTQNLVPPFGNLTPSGNMPKVIFSSDSLSFTVLAADRVVLAWDITKSHNIPLVSLPDQNARLLDQNSDSTRLLTLSGQATLQLWDAASAETLSLPFLNDRAVKSACFSPDASRFLVVGGDRARLWQLFKETRKTDEIIRHAELLSGRRIDNSGNFIRLPASGLSNLWQKAHAERIQDFVMPLGQLEEWRERFAHRCESEQHWFAAAFHLAQLRRNRPEDERLRQRYHHARSQAALETLK